MSVRVLKPGLSTTVQDSGRFGYAHLGISPCGAADALSMRIANLLLGNREDAPVLEMTLLGTALEFLSTAEIVLSGADCDCRLGTDLIPTYTPTTIKAGAVLQCGNITNGARTYLAIRGGIEVPLVMSSASTDLRGGFGGHEGRRLKAGDVLRFGASAISRPRLLRRNALADLRRGEPIRVTQGAQSDWFAPEQYQKLLASSFRVSEQSDRAGLRLTGESAISLREQKQLLTDGIPLGAIQIPQDGQPIILFVDQQTTGGYPKIANVIAADMHRVGQLRPRDEVRFAEVSIPEAVEALRVQERWLQTAWQE